MFRKDSDGAPFTGDSGSGGAQGLVPAPGAGDAAANKVLGAGGGWVTQAGGGSGWTDIATVTNQTSSPASPSSGSSKVYVREIAGYPLLHIERSDGVEQRVYPSQQVTVYARGSTIAESNGNTFTNAGISPTGVIQLGYATSNMVTAATANSGGFVRSAGDAAQNDYSAGLFSYFTFCVPDSSYGSGSTGVRLLIGASSSSNPLGSDLPNTDRILGFRYSTNAGDTNWQLLTSNGTTATATDTGLAFTPQKVMRGSIYVPSSTATVYWTLENLSDGTSASGSSSTTVPTTTWSSISQILMGITTLTTVARNIAFIHGGFFRP